MRRSIATHCILAICLILASLGNISAAELGADRNLLAKKEDEPVKSSGKLTDDQKREQEALKDYQKQQAAREAEKKKILDKAAKDSNEIINSFSRAKTEEAQIDVFINLWRNTQGPALVAVLNTLTVSTKDGSDDYYISMVAESLLRADDAGFSYQIAETIASALTILKREEDADALLRVITKVVDYKDSEKTGKGCYYIKGLFSDAETFAIQSGYQYEFYYAFDDDKNLPLMECFLDKCTGTAAECCVDELAVSTGLCRCESKKSNFCEFNLFWNQPRVIWLCNGEKCESSKCLCPYVKTSEKKQPQTASSVRINKPTSSSKTKSKVVMKPKKIIKYKKVKRNL